MRTVAPRPRRLLCAVALVVLAGGLSQAGPAHAPRQPADLPDRVPAGAPVSEDRQAKVQAAVGGLPLAFEPNWGQTAPEVDFLGRGPGYTLLLTGTTLVLALRHPGAPAGPRAERAVEPPVPRLGMALVHAAPAAPIGEQALPGHVSYFAGHDPAQWQTGIPTYAAVRYPDVYPAIDLVYHGAQGQLEYDFVVAPGADPDTILLAFEGVDALELDSAGDLRLHGPEWALRQRKPVLYQDLAGVRQEIAGGYVRRGTRQVGFAIGPYDTSQPLVIDPVLVYSTYLGGTGSDSGSGIAVDAAGNAYVTGTTGSANFPTTPGAFQTALRGGDAFVTKLNPTGTAAVYST